MDLASHPTPAQTQSEVIDLPAVATAAEELASSVDRRAADMPRSWACAMGLPQRARDLRHIASDALAAADGCEASLRSVTEWLDEDNDLASACSFARVAPL